MARKTHNINLHSGSAEIARLIDYMVGRLDGRYFAGDPSLYRSKKSNVFSHKINSPEIGPKRVFKSRGEKSATEGGQ
jgi:hypothetical protein